MEKTKSGEKAQELAIRATGREDKKGPHQKMSFEPGKIEL
jgi:hypothetical protein